MKNKLFKTVAAAILSVSFLATSATSIEAKTISVQRGDTLWSLANENGVTIKALKEANGLTSDIIFIGQVLQIPTGPVETVLEKKVVDTNGDRLNIRKGPSTAYSIVGRADDHSVVSVLKKESNGWMKINHSGVIGYVNGYYLKDIDEKEPVEEPVKEPEKSPDPVSGEVKTYTVKSGDYLYKIGVMFGVDYKKIVEWNKLKSNIIYTGQVLIVSEPEKETIEAPVEEPIKEPIKEPVKTGVNEPIYYHVVSGDYLYKIANQYNLSLSQLKEMNRLSSNIIYSGQKMKVTESQFIKPTKGYYSSHFRTDHRPDHHGIDIAEGGLVEVQAAADGIVSKSYTSSSYGEVVFIEHTINGEMYETVYAHMRNRDVSVGEKVNQGDRLGYMGNTGNSFGQHLHFELHKGNWNIDKTNGLNPYDYLPR